MIGWCGGSYLAETTAGSSILCRDEDAGNVAACVCFCVYVGLFDEVKAALVCLPGADEDLSRKGRLCLLLSHTNMQHTHWLCPWRVTLTCTDRFCWGEVSHFASLRNQNGSPTCPSNCCSSLTHLLHHWLSCLVFPFFLIFSLIPLF